MTPDKQTKSFLARVTKPATVGAFVAEKAEPPVSDPTAHSDVFLERFCRAFQNIRIPVSEAMFDAHLCVVEEAIANWGDYRTVAQLQDAKKRIEINSRPSLGYDEALEAYHYLNSSLNDAHAPAQSAYSSDYYQLIAQRHSAISEAFWPNPLLQKVAPSQWQWSRRAVDVAVKDLAATLYNPDAPHNLALDANQALIIARLVADAAKAARESVLGEKPQRGIA